MYYNSYMLPPHQKLMESMEPQAKRFNLFPVFVSSIVGLLTLILIYCALWLVVDFAATFYCTGWNEGSMHVQSCTIPGIKKYADNGYAILLFASFSGGLLLLIPSSVAVFFLIFWLTKVRGWKNDNLPSRFFAWSGLFVSIISLIIFISPIVFFGIHCNTISSKSKGVGKNQQEIINSGNHFAV